MGAAVFDKAEEGPKGKAGVEMEEDMVHCGERLKVSLCIAVEIQEQKTTSKQSEKTPT